LARAFARLDDAQRDALYLVAVAGLGYVQAAEALGLPLGTFHSRLARARTRLRDLVDRDGRQRQGPSLSTTEEKR
jgi:DNA-directed RNA polymerase specialized sigma24 family protein